MENKKTLKGRIAAALGALLLVVYTMTDVVSAALYNEQAEAPAAAVQSGETAYETEQAEQSSEETAMPDEAAAAEGEEQTAEEEELTYARLSDEDIKQLAEDDIPLAGYEEYPAESVFEAEIEPYENPLALAEIKVEPSADGTYDLRNLNDEQWAAVVDYYTDLEDHVKNFDISYSSDVLESGDTADHIDRDKNFTIKYTITLNTSKEVDKGCAEIRIPAAIMTDRSGKVITIRGTDGIALPRFNTEPTLAVGDDSKLYNNVDNITKSSRTQFGYYIEDEGAKNETYVIVNYDPLKAGSTWFEVVYDQINVFDIKDGTTWDIEPEIKVNYKYDKRIYVYTGGLLDYSSNEGTLKTIPLKTEWKEFLPNAIEWDPNGYETLAAKATSQIYTDSNGNTYYVVTDNDSFVSVYYTVDTSTGNKTPVYKRELLEDKYYRYENNDWVECDPFSMQMAVWDLTEYEKGGEKYYCYFGNSDETSVYVYYDANGNPKYKKTTLNGTTSYFKVNDGGTAWEAADESELPSNTWIYSVKSRDDKITGTVNTKAEIKSVDKTEGQVTKSVLGDLNSQAQVEQYLGSNVNAASISPAIDLDKNVYVLWEVAVKGENCTQPFELYLDEVLSYNTRQEGLSYTYYDKATGNIVTVSEDNTVLTQADGTNGRIIAVKDADVYSGTITSASGTGTALNYTPMANSEGIWYIGTSDPTDANTDTAMHDSVRKSGEFSKKIYVVAEYPRGNYPAQGVTADQTGGICVDTLIESAGGSLVYVPVNKTWWGANTEYNINALIKAELTGDERANFQDGKGNLVSRDVFKEVVHDIITSESSAAGTSPILNEFVEMLAENLPQLEKFKSMFEGKTNEEIKTYILDAWKNGGDGDKAQIKKACEQYVDDMLESNLVRISEFSNIKTYDPKKIYRDVYNTSNVVLVPHDQIDPLDQKEDSEEHKREDRVPNVPNDFKMGKSASGGKQGWIDIYDNSDDDYFKSTFKFSVNSTATIYGETHYDKYAYFYDEKSYVNLVTADDVVTAEPWGESSSKNTIYGKSYVLDEKDYGYTNAKIVVNEMVYDYVTDIAAYGSETAENALISKAGSPVDRDWHISVSYSGDEWTPYATIKMEDYLADSANWSSDSKGSHVLMLDFENDDQPGLPYRIKVEHNSIDYQSIVKMDLTAAIKKTSPVLGENGKIRSELYQKTDDTLFTSQDPVAEIFKLRLRNYAGLRSQKFELSEDEGGNITATPGKIFSSDSNASGYVLQNSDLVSGNTSITDDSRLTDETEISASAFGNEATASQIYRSNAAVDVTKLEKDSFAEKTSTYTNDLTHGRAHITYNIAGIEGYFFDKDFKNDLDVFTKAGSTTVLPGSSDSGVYYIYDLLPPGVEYEGYSGSNDKPVAGFVKSATNISKEDNWVTTDADGNDLIDISAEIVKEGDPEWQSWGGSNNGRYLIKFKLDFSKLNQEELAKYAFVDSNRWFFGVGIKFPANVSWERYSAAKNTPNIAAYVTDNETIGKRDTQTYMDNGADVPIKEEHGYPDAYAPFRNTDTDSYKSDFDKDEDESEYNRMYAKSMDLGDIARASSTAVGKQVRAEKDTYALFSDHTAVIKGDNYVYNVNVENQAGGAVSSVILYDILDRHVTSQWKGIFQSIDTTPMELMGEIYPMVYYYQDDIEVKADVLDSFASDHMPAVTGTKATAATLPSAGDWADKGWKTKDNYDPSEVTAVAVVLYADAEHTTPYVLNGKQTLSYRITMKAPTNIDLTQNKYATNRPNYRYFKVERDNADENWVIMNDATYYNDPGNVTVVTLGDRRMLKVAKHVESKFSNADEINDMEFTFRLTRLAGVFENDVLTSQEIPCTNIQYQIYPCTFDEKNNINSIDEEHEIEKGVIHTTNENGEFTLHDNECAVFKYVPSTAVTGTEASQYDFDNYRISELSKPFWYELKNVDSTYGSTWYSGGVSSSAASNITDTDAYNSTTVEYYKQTGVTVTNTYRPVVYISKETVAVPADLPTDPTKADAFNTFDYEMTLFEYPVNRRTGEYFKDLVEFKDYYNGLDALITDVGAKITTLNTEKDTGEKTDAQKGEIQKEIDAWTKFNAALVADKALLDAHIIASGKTVDEFFASAKDITAGDITSVDHLLKNSEGVILMSISGFSNTPTGAQKCFKNQISASDSRKNGGVLYEYSVAGSTDIYNTPEGWQSWDNSSGGTEITAEANPFTVTVKAGTVTALPIYIDGGMMYSDYGIRLNSTTNELEYKKDESANYISRYCYKFTEDMDDKYWDDEAGEYKTATDNNESSWKVVYPSGNAAYTNTLGVQGENVMDYENNYRFKDIYLEKTVEPAGKVPKGSDKNSVDTTAFIYQVSRRASESSGGYSKLTSVQYERMSWELWSRDESGKLTEKLMTGKVNSDGTIIAPIANYTGAEKLYTIKVRHAEVGYTYQLEELLKEQDIFGTGYESMSAAQKKSALETKFDYITYNGETGTFTYKDKEADDSEGKGVKFSSQGAALKTTEFTLATDALYAAGSSETSGAVKTGDHSDISEAYAKVDMEIDNIYKLRDLTVTKSIIAKNVDNNMEFTMRVRRADGSALMPLGVSFYRLVNGERTAVTKADPVTGSDTSGSYLEFTLKNGEYAEFKDIGKEGETFLVEEMDWAGINTEGHYIHLDPVDADGEWSAQKEAVLGDDTTATVLNGDSGYMIIAKNYVSAAAGAYDSFAKNYLESTDGNEIEVSIGLREKNSGGEFVVRDSIDANLVYVNGVSQTDLRCIKLKGGQSIIVNLEGLCESLGISYNNVEYEIKENIPKKVEYFKSTETGADVLYSVEQATESGELTGDKGKTSVTVQNKVYKYENVIYKRIGGKDDPTKPGSPLTLVLSDNSQSSKQEGVRWIATGSSFSLADMQAGVTGANGELAVSAFDGWTQPDDGNLTYFAKVYFSAPVKCNVTDKTDTAQLVLSEKYNADWGYLIGYENYGVTDTYVSQDALENKEQWATLKADTIVNTQEKLTGSSRIAVYKKVKPQGDELTDEESKAEFTFTVKQLVNGKYVPAANITYELDGKKYTTDDNGTFTLSHGKTAYLELPQFSYWEITETGKGDYRLLVDDNGDIVYDKGVQYTLDDTDGLAPTDFKMITENETEHLKYNVAEADSGFSLNTDMDILTGIPEGPPVVLVGATTESNSQIYNALRFTFYDERYDTDDSAPFSDSVANNYYSKSDSTRQWLRNLSWCRNSTGDFSGTSVKMSELKLYSDADCTDLLWDATQNSAGTSNYFRQENVTIDYIYTKYNGKVYRLSIVGVGSYAFQVHQDYYASINNTRGQNYQTAQVIKSIKFGANVKKIGTYAFQHNQIEDISFEYINDQQCGVTAIGGYAFQVRVTEAAGNLTLPRKIQYIDTNAFRGHINFKNDGEILIPNTLWYVGAYAFGDGDYKTWSRSPSLIFEDNTLLTKISDRSDNIVANELNPGKIHEFKNGNAYPVFDVVKIGEGVQTIGTDHEASDWSSIKSDYSSLGFWSGDSLNWSTYYNNGGTLERQNGHTKEFIFPKSLKKTGANSIIIKETDLVIIQADDLSNYKGWINHNRIYNTGGFERDLGTLKYVVLTSVDEETMKSYEFEMPFKRQDTSTKEKAYAGISTRSKFIYLPGKSDEQIEAVITEIDNAMKAKYGEGMSDYSKEIIRSYKSVSLNSASTSAAPQHAPASAASLLSAAIWIQMKKQII